VFIYTTRAIPPITRIGDRYRKLRIRLDSGRARWRPRRMLGGSGRPVLRGGFGIAFHRNSMGTYNDIFSGNVGGSIGAKPQ